MLTMTEKFEAKVIKTEGCWIWTANVDKDGYGKMRHGKTNRAAHRISWMIAYGELPNGMLLHSCHNPKCVNPSHLRIGTHEDNMRDRMDNGKYYTGESHPRCRISHDTVDLIKAATGTLEGIAERFGVSRSQVANIKQGRQRRQG